MGKLAIADIRKIYAIAYTQMLAVMVGRPNRQQ